MQSALKKFGNSAGVVIPKPLLAEMGVKIGDQVEMKAEDGRIVIERIVDLPRQGWADDARALASEGEAGLLWPDFSNDEDGKLVW